MGFKVTYVLAEGAELADLCSLLDMEKMGLLKTAGRYSPGADDFITGADLPSDYALVKVRESNSRILNAESLRVISKRYPVLYGTLYENVDCSRTTRWLEGKEVWRVEHNGCENEARHLEVSGNPPPVFEEIRQRIFAMQDEEDQKQEPEVGYIFNIPIDLVEHFTGFRYCHHVANVYWLKKRSS